MTTVQIYPIENSPEQSVELEENTYKSILLGKSNFICTNLANKSLNISEIGQAVTDDDSVTVSATKFTIRDIDGDGEDEAVLWLQINNISDYGFEILHYQNGEIYGLHCNIGHLCCHFLRARFYRSTKFR